MIRFNVFRNIRWATAASLAIVTIALVGTNQRWVGGVAHAAGVVNFIATDDVGPWFQCVGAGCVPAGTESLAVVQPGTDNLSVGLWRDRHAVDHDVAGNVVKHHLQAEAGVLVVLETREADAHSVAQGLLRGVELSRAAVGARDRRR